MIDAEFIIFDLNGTLLDSKKGIVNRIASVLRHFGIANPPMAELAKITGLPLFKIFHELLGEKYAKEAFSLYRRLYAEQGGMIGNEVFSDLYLILKKLRYAGKSLFVVTSRNQEKANALLKHVGLDQCFISVYGPNPVYEASEKGDLLDLMLEREKIPREKAAMIGDTKSDIKGAKENGIAAIGVLWGNGNKEELLSHGADALAETPSDLLSILLP